MDEFIERWNNVKVKPSDLIHIYQVEVLDIKEELPEIPPGKLFRDFPDVSGADSFTLVKNIDEAVPTEGDLVFWEDHIGIFTDGDLMTFRSFESDGHAKVEEYVYELVLGWLHPIAQTPKN